jgi:N-methylhydantoinase A
VLGYVNPDYFLGGALPLRRDLAEEAVSRLAKSLNMTTLQAAAGIRRVVDAQMADAIRVLTIARGYDPRQFSLLAFGGAGPTHAADYARELQVEQVLIPLSDVSSLWSAYGVALADIVHIVEHSEILSEPFQAVRIASRIGEMKATVARMFKANKIEAVDIAFEVKAKMKYKLQTHVVEVPIEHDAQSDVVNLTERFDERYRRLYGSESGYRAAGVEITGLECKGIGRRGLFKEMPRPTREASVGAEQATRQVYWTEADGLLPTRVFRDVDLTSGWRTQGPAVLELPDTTIVIPPDFAASLDDYGNVVLVGSWN